ncbi:hypothetical protein LF599_04260 [Pseudodesulfovibrio thermohalotolerans]|uniref:hypothetical protein n=1 Tax=Pseudodesulfovibrio thermohalotolerans TaxID=2880651 RepID=UPI0024419470|nr:hypothetical protein [Pseudodesulfovibrio thermohalotolerans]WFS63386.1 hypothetical protein LF599_04260 [Pseudodesulfovibrio thermohalotolerans]
MRSDQERQFIAMMNANLELEVRQAITDGTIQRCGTKGKENGKDGAYVIHNARVPFGYGWNWANGKSCRWQADSDEPMPQKEIREQEKALAEIKKEREKGYDRASLQAQRLIDNASTMVDDHHYMFGKGVIGAGPLRVDSTTCSSPSTALITE